MFGPSYIRYAPEEESAALRLVDQGAAADICVSPEDHPGVIRAAGDLQADIERVTGRKPRLVEALEAGGLSGHAVLIGTIGQSPLIDCLIAEGRLDVSRVAGRWESFVIQTVPSPLPGIEWALVIAGSDKRGTIFGIYDVSERIGVSPWHWWADVPPQRRDALYVKPGRYAQGEPSVKYRGIFLNDEGPSLMTWVRDNFRDFTHEFYEKVYELLLRLKANYLWPAMWDNTFYEDDPLNAEVADRYGIVIGTSHHEPMLRPHGDWKLHRKGPWDYSVNGEVLYRFWEEGIRRSQDYESIVTLGMRGDGDEAMGGHLTFEEKIALLERIVRDQRGMIAREMNKDASKVPQLWALYKEVQDYYEHGMRVPDDITLLWSDDNHGNLRRVPTGEERGRSGGAGIYYHLDYVGGPRSYKWVNTVPLPKIWEQMHKAYEYGADRIWILNVGDLKPVELPLEYFLRMAWRISDFTKDNAREFAEAWAERQFGSAYRKAAADVLTGYTKFNGRVKPELLNAVELYSLTDYKEAETALREFHGIVRTAERLYAEMPEELRDACFQLLLYPAKASWQVLELHVRAARSRLYAAQGRTAANLEAREAELLFEADRELTLHYNQLLAQGKWNHMMDQTHIGYTYWNQPPVNVMPETGRVEVRSGAEMGVAVEGSTEVWVAPDSCRLPTLDAFTREARYIEVFNRGSDPFAFRMQADVPWLKLSASEGMVVHQKRIWVDVDWELAPIGERVTGRVDVSGPGDVVVTVEAELFNPASPKREELRGHMETGGVVSIEAEHFARAVPAANGAAWSRIDGYGRTLSSMAVLPVMVPSVERPGAEPDRSPSLEYPVYLTSCGVLDVRLYLAPTIDFVPGSGLRIGVQFDDGPVLVADAISHLADGGFDERDWEQSVIYNVRTAVTRHSIGQPGLHTLRIWMVDPIVALQKIVIDAGGAKPSLLGPPESFWGGAAADVDAVGGTARDGGTPSGGEVGGDAGTGSDGAGVVQIGSAPLAGQEAGGDAYAGSTGAVQGDAAAITMREAVNLGDGYDPFELPGVVDGAFAGLSGEALEVFVRESGLYALELTATAAGPDAPPAAVSLALDGRDLPGGPFLLAPAAGRAGAVLRCAAERLHLPAGRQVLRLRAEGGRAVPQELRLTLTEPDRLAVRPSLRRSGPTDLPLIAQIGLLDAGALYSCRYVLVVSLYGEDDQLYGQAAVTGTVPRAGEDVQRLAFPDREPLQASAVSAPADSCPPPRRYKLKLVLTWEGGQPREYVSEWLL
ncbi:glycosyl hydrolase 115 family protein [uncultured Paenibacillus sp.]|uniref:glycosyl hydrolase 115 family protein n=1 Tax=uncultured Paenibacillus sp. TaxID=227322 RepID=UPI002803D64B|nr:glycosyl hydrolase 115 family protein [uncultured Paenibacillus sp.]